MLRTIRPYYFSVALMKQLKELTGSPIKDCKLALESTSGDLQLAVEFLKEKGLLKAEKKLGNQTGEGVIGAVKQGGKAVFAQINCETDFVARTKDFLRFSERVIQNTLDKEQEGDAQCPELEQERKLLISKLQENITVNRLQLWKETPTSILGVYTHNTYEGSVLGTNACVVELVGDRELGRAALQEGSTNVAISMLGMKPEYIARGDIPAELLDRQKALLREGIDKKDDKIVERIVDGKLKKFYEDKAFLEMPYILDEELKLTMRDYIAKMDNTLRVGRYIFM